MTNEAKLICRDALPEDDSAILSLFRESFSRNLSQLWWDWFSYKCPTGMNHTYLVEDTTSKKIVSSYSLLPIQLIFNGRKHPASICTNVNTHPQYQGQGLFTRMGHYSLKRDNERGIPISLGMPNQKAYPGHKKVGWKIMCQLPFLVRHNCKTREHRCKKIETFDRRFDAFYQKVAARFSFIIDKDHKFMNWRTAERPDKEYSLYILESGNELAGYVVLKNFTDGTVNKSHILDIHALDAEGFNQLLAASESFAVGRDELNVWSNPHNPYEAYFLDSHFTVREGQDMLIIHFNDNEERALENGPWWFCLADNDVY